MKATAVAPANIAFIKYWGKADEALRIPLNDSISMNLSGSYTTTTVDFSVEYANDDVSLISGDFSDKEKARVIEGIMRIRNKTGITQYARVVTKNTFPKGAGAASSASGFAALTVAGFTAVGVKLSEKELTVFARLGSGSACRSIPDGFVVWQGESAYSLYPHDYWDLRDILVIVDSGMKKVSTTEGHKGVKTSPFWKKRNDAVSARMIRITNALKEKNFKELGEVIEEDCLDMHKVMQTQTPPLLYWNDTTKIIMDAIREWRKQGLPVYFTIDAGPNVHLICEKKDQTHVVKYLGSIQGIQEVIVNTPAPGAHVSNIHLF